MTEQEKMEKVIKGLECCTKKLCIYIDTEKECPYIEMCDEYFEDCTTALAKDALALLKAQEPRVMTLDEAKSAYVMEYRSGNMREVGSALLDLNVDPLNAEYGKIYRVWTSRPTDEQRGAVPWN